MEGVLNCPQCKQKFSREDALDRHLKRAIINKSICKLELIGKFKACNAYGK